jgi:methylmalonyl-CoA/ethylmalonyl-CoA epimerase
MFNKDCYLDHVAIAVSNLDRAQKVWEDLGLTFDSAREEVLSQQVTTAFAHVDTHAHIELVCPINEQGPHSKIHRKKWRRNSSHEF